MRPIELAVCAAAALSPLTAVAATPAAPTGVSADARCLMTMAAFTGAKDTNTASTAQLGVLYFAGRIKARDPGYNLGTQLKSVAASMSGQPLKAEADRCGPMVLQVLRELDAAQQTLGPPPGAAGAGAGAGAGGAAKPPASGAPPKR